MRRRASQTPRVRGNRFVAGGSDAAGDDATATDPERVGAIPNDENENPPDHNNALDQSDAKRRKAEYPDLGLAVDHLRLDAIDVAAAPEWMKPGLSPSDQ